MRFTHVCSALALTTLTACGGGGNDGPVYVAPTGPGGLVNLFEESQDLSARFSDRDSAPFGVAGTPGNPATFEGVMVVGKNSPGTTYVGDATLIVDFTGDGSIDGSASGFFVYDSSGATGTTGSSVPDGDVDLNAASLVGDTFVITANGPLDGSLLDGDLQAQFGAVDVLGNGIDGGDTIDALFANGPVTLDGSSWTAVVRACTDGILPTC